MIRKKNRAMSEPAVVRLLLISLSLGFLGLFLFIPLAAVFAEALKKGMAFYIDAVRQPDAVSAIRLTILVAVISVPLNTLFGIAASWTIAKFDFRGKSLLITLIDLPFAVSPVISGLVFVLLFGAQGLMGEWLQEHNIKLIFAVPGIVLATIFVTFPYTARELIPLMQEQGTDEEEAALSIGAGGFQMFCRVTLPNIKWGLLYGVLLCNARAIGEFGAVSVVSGHIRGLTNTVPLHVEILYNEYNFVAAFAVASLLTMMALLTLVVKSIVSGRGKSNPIPLSISPLKGEKYNISLPFKGRVRVGMGVYKEANMSIEIRNICKRFSDFTALDNVSLQVPAGELVALLGPSGSGKMTLLRIIAGLEFADRGEICLHDEKCTDASVRERKIGFVFQHYALFRHLTVFENVAFGLRVQSRKVRPPEDKIRARVHELLELVQLDWLAHQYPSQLSGGQRQRIALARALAVEPRVLLLDEPFGALDAKVRQELRKWLRRLHDELHITSVFVTHDQEEALEVADRVVVMNEGRIEQVGTPEEVYDRPATPFVFNFIGSVNLFHGRVHKGRAQIDGIEFDAPEHADTLLSSAVAYVRPHDIDLDRKRNGEQVIEAVVRQINFVGPLVRLVVAHNGDSPVDVELTRERYDELKLKEGEKVFVKPKKLKVFVENYTI